MSKKVIRRTRTAKRNKAKVGSLRTKVRALTAPDNVLVRKLENGYLVESDNGRKHRSIYFATQDELRKHLARVW